MEHQFNDEKFEKYYNLLIETNAKFNLTAITERDEVCTKHFIDSLAISRYIPNGAMVADIGSGAGFPGIPLAITRPDCKFTLIDSLNKRVTFLKDVSAQLGLVNVSAIHARAEDLGRSSEMREGFDVVVSRAVSNMRVLAELSLPLVKVGGCVIAMKGPEPEDELELSRDLIIRLGGDNISIKKYCLPELDQLNELQIDTECKIISSVPSASAGASNKHAKGECAEGGVSCNKGDENARDKIIHSVVIISKTAATPKNYPRVAKNLGK
ncbi:MAG: 16S rRNA (guanine(527)-N(7))-methyltransferase RsmG [Clostridiales bacterium]|jgi:16S rRNA (guanine527-N7)-methyltransferase|nr:16S rRNA (guanine(527)-N(7))-methyltransferase RsmG [Clostridiales bacterium]